MSDYIPRKIQVRILKHLPVKTLLRFRSVSKRWKQLIDSPTFTKDHLAVQKPRFLVQYDETDFFLLDPLTPHLVDTLIEDGTQRYAVLGTLHGIVCAYNHGTNLLLCNPSIWKFLSIPLPSDIEATFRTAFWHCYGFWIDPSTKEFKIIALLFNSYNEMTESVDLFGFFYSSLRDEWMVISPGKAGQNWIPGQSSAAVIIGSKAYWAGMFAFGNERGRRPKTEFIMSFDFRHECFEFIEMPYLRYKLSWYSRACIWQGNLSVMYWDTNLPHRCNIYSRQEGSWVKVLGFKIKTPIWGVFWPLEGMEERAGL